MTRSPSRRPPNPAAEMPRSLVDELRALDRRVLPQDLEDLVVRLCAWRPLRLRELAGFLGRDDIYLQNTVIKRLLQDRRLDFLHKGRPNHPRQAYVAGPGRRRARAVPKPRPPAAPRPRPPTVPVQPPLPAPEAPPLLMEMPDIGRND